MVEQLECLDLNVISLSDEHLFALSKLTGLKKLCLSSPQHVGAHIHLSHLRALTQLCELSLPYMTPLAGDLTWLAELTHLKTLCLETVPSGPIQLPGSLQTFGIRGGNLEKSLPRLVRIANTGRLPGPECMTVKVEGLLCYHTQDWHAIGTLVSTCWPEHSNITIDNIEIADNVDLFLALCERGPLFGKAIQTVDLHENRQDTCERLKATCPNVKSELVGVWAALLLL